MTNTFKKKLIMLLGDLFIIYLASVIAPFLRFGTSALELRQPLAETGILFLIYFICFYISDLYNLDERFKSFRFLYKLGLANLAASILQVLVSFFIPNISFGRDIIIILSVLVFILTLMLRILFQSTLMKYTHKPRKVFVLGSRDQVDYLSNLLKNKQEYILVPAHDYNSYTNLTMLKETFQNVDMLILSNDNTCNPDLIRQIIDLKLNGIPVYNMAEFCEEVFGRIEVNCLNDNLLINMPLSGVKKTLYNLRLKRIISIFVSLLILSLTSPLIIVSMIAIKLDSKGPVFFKQKRVGINRKVFKLVKFRTMKVGMEQMRQFAGTKKDPRITRVGRILRFFRIDELPQLWNVLKGDMSLIGPRALMLEEVEEFEKKVPYFHLRHSIKPGVTGWAQVNYPHGARVEDALEKLKYDLYYIKNLSPFLDLHILLRTIRVVLLGKGAR